MVASSTSTPISSPTNPGPCSGWRSWAKTVALTVRLVTLLTRERGCYFYTNYRQKIKEGYCATNASLVDGMEQLGADRIKILCRSVQGVVQYGRIIANEWTVPLVRLSILGE